MPFNFSIPRSGGSPLLFHLDAGQILFVLGANGTGKSSLMHLFYRSNPGIAHRITAHRQTWFSSNAITLSPQNKRDTETNIKHQDAAMEARWKDNYSSQRADIAIYDLIDAENVRARSITAAVDSDAINLAKSLSKKDAPIKVINELLRLSNIPIEISVRKNEEVMASRAGGTPYSIAELSDGERNALLMAAEVLTVTEGALVLVDEPERHLHRSIVSPLLTLLFAKRPDCAFIISTHEVMLPLDNPGARTLLVRSCAYAGSSVSEWDVDLMMPETGIDDDLKRYILGERRKLLFVEGTDQSLDKPLYSLVFPNVSVISKSSCRDVEHAVSGIREAAELHWVRAFGIVDNDRRPQTSIEAMKYKGVYTAPVYSVESVYYHPEVQRYVAERNAKVIGADPNNLIEDAKVAALAAIKLQERHLSERAVHNSIRERILQNQPKQQDIHDGIPVKIEIDVIAEVVAEGARLQAALAGNDLALIISQYPVRETGALDAIAGKLGFKNRTTYKGAVLKLLMDDEGALAFVRSLFGDLEADIAAS